ncbi:hypothetical protein MtrunA17_Chr8g0351601 [Medicago truncatula]|uniref:Uncharacterized protein n=1 Tax=Medicago truncatula TaxID=3880 RepID=A0A396GFR9_MEDTR|nr:hypothetical protein MtrunA17_Chr8g0351601 [Medicago truncatula]
MRFQSEVSVLLSLVVEVKINRIMYTISLSFGIDLLIHFVYPHSTEQYIFISIKNAFHFYKAAKVSTLLFFLIHSFRSHLVSGHSFFVCCLFLLLL